MFEEDENTLKYEDLPFKEGDVVKVKESGRIGVIAYIDDDFDTLYHVDFCDEMFDLHSCYYEEYDDCDDYDDICLNEYDFEESEIEKYEPIKISVWQLRALIRYEIGFNQISGHELVISLNDDCRDYKLTAEDLLAGIQSVEKSAGSSEKLFDENFMFWNYTLNYINNEMARTFGKALEYLFVINDDFDGIIMERDISSAALNDIAYASELIYMKNQNRSTAEDNHNIADIQDDKYHTRMYIQYIKNYLESFIQAEMRGSSDFIYPDSIVRNIAYAFDEDNIDSQPENVQLIFKKCLDTLCDLNNPSAIQKRGYCYYCGTDIYPNDWIKARDSFIKYYEMTGDPSAANTLGYIYYYGRCNNGVPEYEKAFKYFSIGHAAGFYESTYKLGDMFTHGYGTVENRSIAEKLYYSVYTETRGQFRSGIYGSKFADAALRMGNVWRDRDNPLIAYEYYLEAQLAIEKRVQEGNYYGDGVVAAGIKEAISNIKEKALENLKEIEYFYPDWIESCIDRSRRYFVKIRENENGEHILTITVIRNPREGDAQMFLYTSVRKGQCELSDRLVVKTSEKSIVKVMSGYGPFVFNDISYNHSDRSMKFFIDGEKSAEIKSDSFNIVFQKKAAADEGEVRNNSSGAVYRMARICFQQGGRGYDYICEDLSIAEGDRVIVSGYSGETEVEVVMIHEVSEDDLFMPAEKYKHVIRKV